MLEPRYTDDPFDDRDMSVENAGFQYPELCIRAFKACGRTRMMFKNDAEISRWTRIDKELYYGNMPPEWIEDRCKLEEKHHHGFKWLMSAILNTANMGEWMAKNRIFPSGD